MKKALSLLMSLVMILSALPLNAITAFAEENFYKFSNYTETEYLNMLKNKTSENVLEFLYDDYDADGTYEVFAVTSNNSISVEENLLVNCNIWFINKDGANKIKSKFGAKTNGEEVAEVYEANGTKFVVYKEWYATGDAAYIWYVKDSNAVYDSEASGKMCFFKYDEENDWFVGCQSAYDGCSEGTGHTWKEYYFYYNDGLKEYGGIEISEQRLREINGAAEVLDKIKEDNGNLQKIYARGNGIININYTYDGELTSNENATLILKNGKANLVNFWNDGEATLSNSSQGGVYSAAYIPSIATYPSDYRFLDELLSVDASDEDIIKIYMDNAKVWSKGSDFSAMNGYGYTFIDLDMDGILELVVSVCDGSGRYSFNEYYKVNIVNKTVEEIPYGTPDDDDGFDYLYFKEGEYPKLLKNKNDGSFKYYGYDYSRSSTGVYYNFYGTLSLSDGYINVNYLFSEFYDEVNQVYEYYYIIPDTPSGEMISIDKTEYEKRVNEFLDNYDDLNLNWKLVDGYNFDGASTEKQKELLTEAYNAFSHDDTITGILNDSVLTVVLNGNESYVSDLIIDGKYYECQYKAILPDTVERLKNKLIDAKIVDNKVTEISLNTYVEKNEYINEHISMYKYYAGYWDDINFFNRVNYEKLQTNAGVSRIWDTIKDVGEVATLSLDKLQKNADYYEIYLADMMLAFSEKTIEDDVKWDMGDYYTKGFKGIDAFLKSSKEYYTYEDILGNLDLESAFLKDDIPDEVKDTFSTVFKDAYKNNPQLLHDIYQGLDCANEICEDISTGLDAFNSLKTCYQAYCVSAATKEMNEEFFDFCYDVIDEMQKSNPQNAQWFKNAVDNFYKNKQSDYDLYLASKVVLEGAKTIGEAFFKGVAKELIYNEVAMYLGVGSLEILTVIAAYEVGVALAELAASCDTDSVYYMYYICPVAGAMQTVLGEYYNKMNSSKSLYDTKKYDIAFNTFKHTNIALYKKCYNFADSHHILWIKTKSMKENKELATYHMNLWSQTACHKGDYALLDESADRKIVKVHCPVDVIVYNSNNDVILEIINEEVTKYNNKNITVSLCNGQKTIAYPVDEKYSVKIIARQDGVMNYSVISLFDGKARYIDYYDVKLTEGLEFYADLPEDHDAPTEEYALRTDSEILTPDFDGFYVSLGDVNNDGKVTIADAKWVLKYVAKTMELDGAQFTAADVNCDGQVSIVDAKWILQVIAGTRDLENAPVKPDNPDEPDEPENFPEELDIESSAELFINFFNVEYINFVPDDDGLLYTFDANSIDENRMSDFTEYIEEYGFELTDCNDSIYSYYNSDLKIAVDVIFGNEESDTADVVFLTSMYWDEEEPDYNDNEFTFSDYGVPDFDEVTGITHTRIIVNSEDLIYIYDDNDITQELLEEYFAALESYGFKMEDISNADFQLYCFINTDTNVGVTVSYVDNGEWMVAAFYDTAY